MEKNFYCRESKFNEKILSIFYKTGDLYMNNMGIFLFAYLEIIYEHKKFDSKYFLPY